jgi:hypothetical protein
MEVEASGLHFNGTARRTRILQLIPERLVFRLFMCRQDVVALESSRGD